MYDCEVLTGNLGKMGRKLEIWIWSSGKKLEIQMLNFTAN
jgi:hypothetical protein